MALKETACKQHFDCYRSGTYYRYSYLGIRCYFPVWFVQIHPEIITVHAMLLENKFFPFYSVSAVALLNSGILLPAALSLGYGFLTIRKDEQAVVDFIVYAFRFFISGQQYYEWREP